MQPPRTFLVWNPIRAARHVRCTYHYIFSFKKRLLNKSAVPEPLTRLRRLATKQNSPAEVRPYRNLPTLIRQARESSTALLLCQKPTHREANLVTLVHEAFAPPHYQPRSQVSQHPGHGVMIMLGKGALGRTTTMPSTASKRIHSWPSSRARQHTPEHPFLLPSGNDNRPTIDSGNCHHPTGWGTNPTNRNPSLARRQARD